MPFALILVLLFFAQPFWEAREPAEWTEEQLAILLNDSPWARRVAFLATAAPMQLAEQQWRTRHIPKDPNGPDPVDPDYADFLRDHAATHIVLAVRIERPNELAKSEEIAAMEKESTLRAGRAKIRMSGHFPPMGLDPFLRLAFPRPKTEFKSLQFDLYLPGVTGTFHAIEFDAKEMNWHGKLEY